MGGMGLKLVIAGSPVRSRLGLSLEDLGHELAEFSTVDDVLAELGPRPPDVVLVALTPEGSGGIGCVHEVRRDHDVPILLLGARTDTAGIVAALEAGADDYVTEPYEVGEVVARLRALRRRARAGHGQDGLRDVLLEAHPHDPLVLSPVSETVRRGDRDLSLTATEYRLLHELAHAPGRILHRHALFERLWQGAVPGNGRALNVHIRRLRTKIELDPARPRIVVTVRGFGYRLDVRV
jgi:DNA-binding response OmpR family regulator